MITTNQLYYQDNQLREFEAHVVSIEPSERGFRVILDQTAFFPEGGGQPADRGTLSGIEVLDVQIESDHIVHYLKQKPSGNTVTGILDWDHRFHSMQQHTGQHIISAAFWAENRSKTASVHLGKAYTTIEFETESMTRAEMRAGERLANRIIGQNLPVSVLYPSADELKNMTLRRPTNKTEHVRLVLIGEVDCVACGGVHCSRTGEVGLVKVIAHEKIRGNTRLIFKIGGDAYADYDLKNQIMSELRTELNVQDQHLLERVQQLEHSLVESTRSLHVLEQKLARNMAEYIYAGREQDHELPFDWVVFFFEQEEERLIKEIAKELLKREQVACCLINRYTDHYTWTLTESERVSIPFVELRERLFERTRAKGGGRAPMWQGIGPDPHQAEVFGQTIRQLLQEYCPR
ncbi:alanyl-tRNA editing protein [bacterium]|nr:alanyl-tRNA editing protein [bacterium]